MDFMQAVVSRDGQQKKGSKPVFLNNLLLPFLQTKTQSLNLFKPLSTICVTVKSNEITKIFLTVRIRNSLYEGPY